MVVVGVITFLGGMAYWFDSFCLGAVVNIEFSARNNCALEWFKSQFRMGPFESPVYSVHE